MYMKWGKGTLETIGKVLKGWIGRGRRGILGAEEEKIKGGGRFKHFPESGFLDEG